MTGTDRAVERGGRWVAARASRRSFLGRIGKAAMLVAGGPSLVAFLAQRAEARVCGQSGVAPKCPTYDCTGPNDVWGWCWYASPGCCAGGGLKKICDCCRFQHPFVHGYCPSGYNVFCIVESCHSDPRVQRVPLDIIRAERAVTAAARLAVTWRPNGAHTVVIGDEGDPLAAAVAAGVAGAANAPLLLTFRGHLASGTINAIQRLRASRAIVVGHALASAVDSSLASYGLAVERLGSSADLSTWSLEVARHVCSTWRVSRALCVEPSGVSAAAASPAGSAAGALGYPLVVGVDTAAELATGPAPRPIVTYLVGPEASARAGEVAGGHPLRSGSVEQLARDLGDVVIGTEGRRGVAVALVPAGHAGPAIGMGHPGGILLIHPSGVLDGANAAWIRAHQPAITRGYSGGMLGALGTDGIWMLQSALNHFDAHLLIGVAGQGLPVISQPLSERELGGARIAGAPEDDSGSYWIARANPSNH